MRPCRDTALLAEGDHICDDREGQGTAPPMIALDVLAAILFVASSGILFNERFRRNLPLVTAAGAIAVVSTALLLQQLVGYLVRSEMRRQVVAASTSAPTTTAARSFEGNKFGSANAVAATNRGKDFPVQNASSPAMPPASKAEVMPAALSSPTSLGGTVWHSYDQIYDLMFRSDGSVAFQGKGDWEDYGTWEQRGTKVTITVRGGTEEGTIQGRKMTIVFASGSSNRFNRITCSQAEGGRCPPAGPLPRYD